MTLFEQLGGAAGVRTLVDGFYDHMDTLEQAAQIRAMHPDDLASSRDHFALFLNMWTGGPRTYVEQRGHPRLRARHMPFPIGPADRDAWMLCMERALADHVDDQGVRTALYDALLRVADHMRNQ
jgi:hemoglobin